MCVYVSVYVCVCLCWCPCGWVCVIVLTRFRCRLISCGVQAGSGGKPIKVSAVFVLRFLSGAVCTGLFGPQRHLHRHKQHRCVCLLFLRLLSIITHNRTCWSRPCLRALSHLAHRCIFRQLDPHLRLGVGRVFGTRLRPLKNRNRYAMGSSFMVSSSHTCAAYV